MNYLREINAFYDWLETNPLSTSSIALWYALMHMNNKTGWAEEFAVAVSVLCVKTGLSPRAIYDARNELKIKGRLQWKSRNGNQSAVYGLQPLCATGADNTADKPVGNTADKPVDKPAPLNKPKRKQKEVIFSLEFESFWEIYLNQTGKTDALKAWSARLKEGKTPEQITEAAKKYMADCKQRGTETQFIKHPKTFLGTGGHIDEWLKGGKPRGHPPGDLSTAEQERKRDLVKKLYLAGR